MKWSKKLDALTYSEKFISNDGLLLIVFENGPLGILSLIGGGGLLNDIQNCGLTPDAIIKQYLMWNQSEKALNLLLSLNWNTNGSTCLAGLYHLANYLFRQPFTPEKEIQLEAALGTFYSPTRPLTQFAKNEFGNQIHDLTRRFFHNLLRHKLYEKAYCLAIDLGNSDLFIDLYHCAKLIENEEMEIACKEKFKEFNSLSEDSSHSYCSHSSCSCSECESTQEEEDEEGTILPPLPQVSVKKSKASKVPPLPDLNRHSKLKSSAFFNGISPYTFSDAINNFNKIQSSKCFNSTPVPVSLNEYYSPNVNHSSELHDCNFSNIHFSNSKFPYSYEICTSFSGDESHTNDFTPIEPAPLPSTDYKEPRNFNYFYRSNGTDKILEHLYERTSPLNISTIQTENLKRDMMRCRSNPALNDTENLKSEHCFNQVSKNNRINNSYNLYSSYGTSKNDTLSYLNNSQVQSKSLPNKSQSKIQINSSSGSSFHMPKEIVPTFYQFGSPSKPYNNNNDKNLLLQRPLQFVPNVYHTDMTKSMSVNNGKQKVKFSDTVTQILLPVRFLS